MEFVVVVIFETTPEQHDKTFRLLDEYIDGFLRLQPGFIESRLNEKQDGTGFLHYARWQQESDFRAFAGKAQEHPLLLEIRLLNASANFYSVARHYTAQPDGEKQ